MTESLGYFDFLMGSAMRIWIGYRAVGLVSFDSMGLVPDRAIINLLSSSKRTRRPLLMVLFICVLLRINWVWFEPHAHGQKFEVE